MRNRVPRPRPPRQEEHGGGDERCGAEALAAPPPVGEPTDRILARPGHPAEEIARLRRDRAIRAAPGPRRGQILTMDTSLDALQRIAVAVTPAVMVSACGLVALGLDNQVARMSARLRELAREHRDLPEGHARRRLVQPQVEAFDSRHRILTRALQLDYGALLAFVVTSFLELATGLLPVPPALPLATFAVGVLLLGGMAVFVMRSMHLARRALVLERHAIEAALLSGA